MQVSVCVGNYATTPYVIPGMDIQIYCIEELCYCLKENAFLVDMSILDEKLVEWIDKECGISELARALYPMVRKQGSVSAFVGLIMEYVGLYDSVSLQELDRVLKEGSGLSGIEKRKKQIDYLVRRKKYSAAVFRYDELLGRWEEAGERAENSGSRVKSAIWHNKGVALAGMMEYEAAAQCFWEAYETDRNAESYLAYLGAKRIVLNEADYLAFITNQPDSYEQSLQLERKVEGLEEGFRRQEAYIKLEELKAWKVDGSRQKYYDELERVLRVLKEQYRSSMNE